MKEKNIGSSFDSWLKEEGIYEEATSKAIKRVPAQQACDSVTSRSQPLAAIELLPVCPDRLAHRVAALGAATIVAKHANVVAALDALQIDRNPASIIQNLPRQSWNAKICTHSTLPGRRKSRAMAS